MKLAVVLEDAGKYACRNLRRNTLWKETNWDTRIFAIIKLDPR